MLEGLPLVVVGLHVAVGLGAHHRDPPAPPRLHQRGARSTREVGAARQRHRCVQAVGPPGAEVDDHPARSSLDDPRRLGGDQRVDVQPRQQHRLHQLRLQDAALDPQDRLVGKDGGALGQGPHVALEAEALQPLEERFSEAQAAQVVQVVRLEAQTLEAGERVVQACGQGVVPAGWQAPEEELERGAPLHAPGEIGLGHRQLVLIGEERVAHLAAPASVAASTTRAPAASIAWKARSESPGCRSMPLQASRITWTSKPSSSASRVEKRTQ